MLAHLLSQDPASQSPLYGPLLKKLAQSVAFNRVAAGLHYPIDSIAGQALGEVLAEYMVGCCVGPVAIQPLTISCDAAEPSKDHEKNFDKCVHPMDGKDKTSCARRSLLPWLWKQARAEWGFNE